MNGNKPLVPFASEFTERVAGHSGVAYYPYLYPSPHCRVLVKMVIDEILVAREIVADVQGMLQTYASYTGATVFAGLFHPDDSQDVEIWRLHEVSGGFGHPDVAEVVWRAREEHQHVQGRVAPNHVLIPAPYFHDCPWGPPEEHDKLLLPPQAMPPVQVTVIDAGYRHVGPVAWRIDGPPDYGEWFDGNGWIAEPPTRRNVEGESLFALTGHANFVAGVVAQECPNAAIKIVSHNASFVESDDAVIPIPTEASVARSLWRSRDADVINVGFAFATLPSERRRMNLPVRDTAPPSWTLEVVLGLMNLDKHLVVAPAGNQGCTAPQYPAAFPPVVGVGSRRYALPSDFSNRGGWVDCYVEGENVVSTFIDDWVGQTEEGDPPGAINGVFPTKDFRSGWAMWSGTSFAAPQVTGQVALRTLLRGQTPGQAWQGWKDEYDRIPIAVPDTRRRP